MTTWHALLEHLSWMAPSLGLALAAALVVALLYAVVAARPLWLLPLYWGLSLAGLAGGQAIALMGPRWLPVGDLALGTGLAVCALLFALLSLLRLWYTKGRRTRPNVRSSPLRREKLHR